MGPGINGIKGKDCMQGLERIATPNISEECYAESIQVMQD